MLPLVSCRRWDADQIAEAALLAGMATISTSRPDACLPGFESLLEAENSNLGAVLAVRAAIRRLLKGEVQALATVGRRRAADLLEARGVALVDVDAAAEHRAVAQSAVTLFTQLAGFRGPLAETIRDLAALVTASRPASAVVAEHIDRVRAALEAELCG